MQNRYMPEGGLSGTAENSEYISSDQGLERAMQLGKILESTALLCDGNMDLHIDLRGARGVIERSEVCYDPSGAPVKDIAIITRVGKPVCFKVIGTGEDRYGRYYRLSRREAQIECMRNYLDDLIPGDVISAKVTHLEPFGAFVDIGCGISSLLSVDCISVSRIAHPRDRLFCGMPIRCVVRSVDEASRRIYVSMRELLGTWEENAAAFEAGQTVAGIVRSVENYGVFVELTPNLAGLAELKDRSAGIVAGKTAAVYIKNIIPDRMKVKLAIIDTCAEPAAPARELKYFIGENVLHIDRWRYSPPEASKVIESIF